MFRSISRSLLGAGLLAVAIGVVAIVWPGVTIAFVVAIFAVAAFVAAVHQGMRALSSATAGPVAGHLLGFGGLLSVAFGVVLFARPDVGAVSLATVFGLFSLSYGVWGVVVAARTHQYAARLDEAVQHHA